MPNYQNGKIYCIRSHQTDKVYLGSTCQKLCKRMATHRSKYKRFLNGNHHNVTSFDILSYDDAYIELIQHYPCDTKEELHKREGQYIRKLNCVNKCVPGRTKKEYYNENKEFVKTIMKKYRDSHKQEKKEYDRKFRIKNLEKINKRMKAKIKCDVCNCEVSYCHMARHKKSQKHINNLK
jgi:hypothetical protein